MKCPSAKTISEIDGVGGEMVAAGGPTISDACGYSRPAGQSGVGVVIQDMPLPISQVRQIVSTGPGAPTEAPATEPAPEYGGESYWQAGPTTKGSNSMYGCALYVDQRTSTLSIAVGSDRISKQNACSAVERLYTVVSGLAP